MPCVWLAIRPARARAAGSLCAGRRHRGFRATRRCVETRATRGAFTVRSLQGPRSGPGAPGTAGTHGLAELAVAARPFDTKLVYSFSTNAGVWDRQLCRVRSVSCGPWRVPLRPSRAACALRGRRAATSPAITGQLALATTRRWCYCDKFWSRLDECSIPEAGSSQPLPFLCPMDHVLDPQFWHGTVSARTMQYECAPPPAAARRSAQLTFRCSTNCMAGEWCVLQIRALHQPTL